MPVWWYCYRAGHSLPDVEMVVQENPDREVDVKLKKVRVRHSSWHSQFRLGFYYDWTEDTAGEYEVGVDIGSYIFGLIFEAEPKDVLLQTNRGAKFPIGARLQRDFLTYRYAYAGEELKKGVIVEADVAGRIAPPPGPNTIQVTSELIYGNVKAATEVNRHGITVLGWPLVNVKKGRFCWLQEPPMGAKFEKEEGEEK